MTEPRKLTLEWFQAFPLGGKGFGLSGRIQHKHDCEALIEWLQANYESLPEAKNAN